jgi:hypothetical protein
LQGAKIANPARHLIVAASVVLMIGCREPSPSTGSVAAEGDGPGGSIAVSQTDSAGVRIVSISGSVDSLPQWSLSEPALNEISAAAAPFIGGVGAVAFLGDGQLLVEDNRTAELRVFDADGQVLRLWGGRGDGPGEFQRIMRLSVTPGDTVYAFDLNHSRISGFDPGGALVTTVPVPQGFAGRGTFADEGWALGSDRFLLFGRRPDPRESGGPVAAPRLLVRNGIVGVVASDGTALAPPVEIPGGSLIFGDRAVLESPFSNHPFVTTNGNRIVTGSGRTYELVLRDSDLRPITIVRWSGWARPMTNSVIEALYDPMKASVESLRSLFPANVVAAQLPILELMFNPELLPDTLPALGGVLMDESGRVWVARFQPPIDFRVALSGRVDYEWRQEDIWHVLAADGKPIARVRLPAETRLLAVRSDRIAVVTRDDLDAETVRVLAIEQISPRTTTAGVGP